MKKIYYAALIYMIGGLLAGIYYREITKAAGFTGYSMVSVLHTHLLTLGMFFFLIVLLLEKSFALTKSKLFPAFFWVYNLGIVWTVGMMAVHGTMTITGISVGPAISGIAGLGHIILSVGLILFFILLKERIVPKTKQE
ncbi:DUF2871 domain-containing protein [Sporolactobacillus sp. THM7-7]|nr:DUF2871 domain-containing protein [Sporolactobacillus sp. THM7-7]